LYRQFVTLCGGLIKLVESNVMDEDFYVEMKGESVFESDEEIRPPHIATN